MNYTDTELVFTPGQLPATFTAKDFGKGKIKAFEKDSTSELLGITLRLGNRPLVYSLEELRRRSGKPSVSEQASALEYYLVVHAISAIRTQGTARVDELQYFASAIEPSELQTVDLVPKTRFRELVNTGVDLAASLGLFGEVSMDVPPGLTDHLLSETISIGPGMHLQLSAAARFIGRFSYSLQVPVVQASGTGSGACSWILRPNEEQVPLLGDQLLVQSIAVPKGTKAIRYAISGLVKADKGLLWKQQQLKTPEYIIEVQLSRN